MVVSKSLHKFAEDRGLFPQAPTKMIIRIDNELMFPKVHGVSSLLVRSGGDALFSESACASTPTTLSNACVRLAEHHDLAIDFPGLFDELSKYGKFDTTKDVLSQVPKIHREFAAMRSLPSTKAFLQNASASSFIDLIKKIHRKNRQGSDTFRRTSVHIAPDERGNVVVFPHHSQCVSLMENLFFFISRHLASYPALCAVVAYVAVIHAHPFTDGNGRTARTLFNVIMRDGASSSHFVPIRAISLLSNGGFLIRLRRAMYEANWDSIQEFFSSAIRLSDWSQRDDCGLDSPRSTVLT